ncbi:MAG: hypothetical protein IJ371_02960 [Clostridia bacterium]|nr:hypothetical protein [Clostridia bacterium]
MKHTKGWLIFWIVVDILMTIFWVYVGVLKSKEAGSWIVGAYFWLFALIFLVCLIKVIAQLIRNNWIEREALYEIYREEVQMAKDYYRKEWDFRNGKY